MNKMNQYFSTLYISVFLKVSQSPSECATMLGSLLGSPGVGPPGPTHLRLISQGQEISQELDERTLAELGFKVAYQNKQWRELYSFYPFAGLAASFCLTGNWSCKRRAE